mmetsp:Transcript_143215/g.457625  ORF Transcript_143215/g.457625 Transcript_143215/m.457625 type:complete len:278 (-) Transcript_143215:913-1746(-)
MCARRAQRARREPGRHIRKRAHGACRAHTSTNSRVLAWDAVIAGPSARGGGGAFGAHCAGTPARLAVLALLAGRAEAGTLGCELACGAIRALCGSIRGVGACGADGATGAGARSGGVGGAARGAGLARLGGSGACGRGVAATGAGAACALGRGAGGRRVLACAARCAGAGAGGGPLAGRADLAGVRALVGVLAAVARRASACGLRGTVARRARSAHIGRTGTCGARIGTRPASLAGLAAAGARGRGVATAPAGGAAALGGLPSQARVLASTTRDARG